MKTTIKMERKQVRQPSNDFVSGFARKIVLMNFPLLLLTLVGAFVGVMMLYSAGGGQMLPWAGSQLYKVIAGVVLMFTIALMPQSYLFRYIYYFYGIGIVLLIVVEIFGHTGLGAQRWLKIGALTIQPSEPMKIFVILALARYFHVESTDEVRRKFVPLMPLVIMGVPGILILKQPNLGTAVILLGTGAMMMFYSGVRARFFVACIAIALAAAPVGWHFLHDYQKQRIKTFMEPEADPLGAGYNIMQSKIAIGSSGLTGKGFLKGTQSQLSFLPEKQTDFIFTTIAEEFGFMGGMMVIVLYAGIIFFILLTASSSRNHFGRMAASGIASMIFLHVFINVGMVMGILPVVGVPLPLLSYGGTIVLTIFASIGIVLNIHANRDKPFVRSAGEVFSF